MRHTTTKRSSRRLATPGLAGLAALAAAACGTGQASESDLELETATVERRTIESSVEATGTVEPIKLVEVKSQASGEILEMPVELGDQIERGDLVLRIDPRDEVNEVQQAEADLELARSQTQVADSRLERARALRDSGVVTAEELETAVLEHANARSALIKAQTRLELASEQRADATVRAPIGGTIVARHVEEGQIITSTRDVTGGTSLLDMADLSEVQVRTLVDESEIGRVEPGLPAEITVEAYPDRTFRGSVLKVEPSATVEQNVTMFAVLTRIPNDDRLLRPGMNADVEIVIGSKSDVLALPNSGVKTPDEARRLVEAIGLDESLLERRVEAPGGGSGPAAGDGEPAGGAGDGSGSEPADDLPSPERVRSMSAEERRELFESLSADQRRRLMQQMREAREAGEGLQRSGQPRPAFVFVRTSEGGLTLRPIRIGLSSWEYTEVVAGLEEGDTVVQVPLALVQQRELLRRVRARSGVPGMGG